MVVGDDAVLQGAVGDNRLRRPADHFAGLVAHGEDAVVIRGHRHHRGLVYHDALFWNKNQRIGSSQINTDLSYEHGFESRIKNHGHGAYNKVLASLILDS